MCGILAIVADRTGGLPGDAAERAIRALDAIAHRGPDARGLWVDPTNTVLLGHVRLSVIDVRAESNQPFWSDCGGHGVVFNGEIYNFLEIRAELEKEGARFRTNSDTEVLLQAILRWGPDAVRRFNGMWAFACVNLRAKTVLVCRDRFGVKPLYVGRVDGATIFASEAKAIVAYMRQQPRPNRESIALYLKYGIGGEHEHSWYEGIDRFPPAHRASLDWRSGDTRPALPQRFWDYPSQRQPMKADEAQAELTELLSDAVRIRLRSDVPLGLSLSGGLDSSIIAWILRDRFDRGVEAYSAWFEPRRQSEIERAERTSSRYGHRLHPVPEPSSDAIADDLAHCIWHLDSPHLSTAIVPYLNICTNARRSLTVMLEGQGADELLGGYAFLYPFATADYLASGSLQQAWMTFSAETRAGNLKSTLGNLLAYSSRAFAERSSRAWGSEILAPGLLDCRHPDPLRFGPRCDNLDHALRNEHTRRLRNLLQYGDALSMSVNLETRCPFMDFRVVELGFRMPASQLIHAGAGKYVLRRIAEGHLDRDIVWPTKKDGFTNKTIPRLRDHATRRGLSAPAIQNAIDLGLLRHGPDLEPSLMQLPDEPFYRIMSTLIWIDQWAGRSRPEDRRGLTGNLAAP